MTCSILSGNISRIAFEFMFPLQANVAQSSAAILNDLRSMYHTHDRWCLPTQRFWPPQVALHTHNRTPRTASFCCEEGRIPDTAAQSALLATVVWFVDWGDVERQRRGHCSNGGWDNGPSLIRDLKVCHEVNFNAGGTCISGWKTKQNKKNLTKKKNGVHCVLTSAPQARICLSLSFSFCVAFTF